MLFRSVFGGEELDISCLENVIGGGNGSGVAVHEAIVENEGAESVLRILARLAGTVEGSPRRNGFSREFLPFIPRERNR